MTYYGETRYNETGHITGVGKTDIQELEQRHQEYISGMQEAIDVLSYAGEEYTEEYYNGEENELGYKLCIERASKVVEFCQSMIEAAIIETMVGFSEIESKHGE